MTSIRKFCVVALTLLTLIRCQQTSSQVFQNGLDDIKAKRWEQCAANFRTLISANYSPAEANSNLGLCLFNLKRYDEAVAALKEAVRLKPDLATAHSLLGAVHYERADYAQAVPAYQAAVKLRPDNASTWTSLGNSLDYLGRYNEAIAAYVKATEIDPAKALPHIEIGVAHYRQRTTRPPSRPFRRQRRSNRAVREHMTDCALRTSDLHATLTRLPRVPRPSTSTRTTKRSLRP